ncbi:CotH kinase family protein [Paenibacillus sp. J2TS4]|uniref:CotH kinase family protein n=1 Tax=Paenibacillus sp. J2TS4 TaxID=2807194 RepID=UPI001B2BA44C|nr:CotH kinase family protein [Paenibacillus sp. J2TS4]GIP35743.1 spore coat protein H [Paenibacillus sp. J2TS4]
MSLPIRHVIIRDPQLDLLQKDVWSKKFVDAYILNQDSREPIKLRHRGGHTREYPKRSYEIVMDKETYHWNAEYDDPSMIRNALSFQFFQWIGVPSPQTRPVRLYMNGQNLGVYLEIEAVDRRFFRRRGISVQSIFYAINDNANFGVIDPDTSRRKHSLFDGYELILGGNKSRLQLQSFISKLNTLSGQRLSTFLSSNLDIENYLRWLAGAVFTGNYDGFDHNYTLYRHKSRGIYRMVPWDYEGTWGRNCYGKPCGSDLVRITGYNHLTKKLLEYPRVRKRYKAILEDILKTHFTTRRIMPVIHQLHSKISPYIYRDHGRKWSFSTFHGEPDFMRNYIVERRKLIAKDMTRL